MDYSSFLINSACQYSFSKLDQIQKRCIRLIEYSKKDQQEKDLGILLKNYKKTIRNRRKKQLLSFMYAESELSLKLTTGNSKIVLRSDNKVKFIEKLMRKTTVQNSPYYRGIKQWNMLPENIHKSGTLLKFKQQLKGVKVKGYYLTYACV